MTSDLSDSVEAVNTNLVSVCAVVTRGTTKVASREDAAGSLATRGETTEHLRRGLNLGREGGVATGERVRVGREARAGLLFQGC